MSRAIAVADDFDPVPSAAHRPVVEVVAEPPGGGIVGVPVGMGDAPAPVGVPARSALAAVGFTGARGTSLPVPGDDATIAFDRRCPHLGCPVLWSAERTRFECPCHHAAFDARTGEVLFGPPRRGLAPAIVRRA